MLELFRLFQRQTTERMSADLLRNMYQLIGERERIIGSLGTGAALTAQGKDVEQAMQNITSAFKNLLYEIGGTGENVASALNSIANSIDTVHRALNWFTGWYKSAGTPQYLPGEVNRFGFPITPPGASVPSIAPPGVFETPGGAGFVGPPTGKHSYNAVPPPAGGGSNGGDGNVYLDGRKMGEILIPRLSAMLGGPSQGSPYFDGTWSSPAQDLSLSQG